MATPTRIPSQQQEWPGSDADLTPRADHGEHSWTPRERLTGKRALITGGDSGIGRAVAIVFAREGAEVAIAFLPEEEEDAAETARVVRSAGGRCALFPSDLRTHQACVKLAAGVVAELGGLDVLVCNAGFQQTYDQLEKFPPEQIERTFATNVFSTFWL
ncbi:MAG TPA: SDR family NAD(P)-dependent oxidoreductase, partial [Propionicimonas sp.]|nr:SDR family NAD(P)-dependent oxidoreductase [Propionicimonas sp.]